MPILLCRVDDRLIHGQVVVGWGAQLGVDFIAVIDDELAATDWEQDLYRAGLPEEIEVYFRTVDEAVEEIRVWADAAARGFVLTRDLETMRRLADQGALTGIEINLGGLHDAPGRRRVLPYLFLGDDDRRELTSLLATGVHVTAQDVPTAAKVEAAEILRLGSD